MTSNTITNVSTNTPIASITTTITSDITSVTTKNSSKPVKNSPAIIKAPPKTTKKKPITNKSQTTTILTKTIPITTKTTPIQSNIPSTTPSTDKKEKTMTPMQYYSYVIQIRDLKKITINSCGTLFQEYVTDQYSKIELQRLLFVKNNQKHLRSELYGDLQDLATNVHHVNLGEVGKRVILPSSFHGSPRHMHQLYQDSMALIRKYGKPDLFITMTCNPCWPEICKLKFQLGEDRPDLCARVFNLKLKELMDDLTKKHIFGEVNSYLYVVEFQKRGLPHAHILLILNEQYKLRTTDDYDKIVSAELPDLKSNPKMHETIRRHNIHGPCGKLNESATCMVNGKCSKRYPREFINITTEDENGYPRYKRPNKGTFIVGKYKLDNKWIVPYNAFLSTKFDCHINVEVCTTVKAVKYLYKYVYKGIFCYLYFKFT